MSIVLLLLLLLLRERIQSGGLFTLSGGISGDPRGPATSLILVIIEERIGKLLLLPAA